LAAFDPTLLRRFDVVGLPKPLPGDPSQEFRRFIVLKHYEDGSFVTVLAPITRTAPYLNDPDLKAGCVYYPAGTAPGFPTSDVVIEPRRSHRHALTYDEIAAAEQRGDFRDFGALPEDFLARFKEAIEKNGLLNRTEKSACRQLVD
jgi:hypothetical protein